MPRLNKRIHVRIPPGRRRLQRAVGPGHGSRRVFGSPDREYGRDTEVATTGRDVTIRDQATGPPAYDPATDDTARDDHSRRRDRRPAIPHATSLIARDQATGYPAATGHTRRSDRRRTIRHAMIISCPTMPGNARKCPEYVRNMFGYSR